MEIFLDTANIEEIKTILPWGIISGVTTNQKIFSAEKGINFKDRVLEILSLVNGPVSIEVTNANGTDEELIAEAKEYAAWGKNIVIKIPMWGDGRGLRVASKLKALGIKTNITCLITTNQAMLAAKVGATYASLFFNRIKDSQADPIIVIQESRRIIEESNSPTKIIVGSIRKPIDVTEAVVAGAHVMTIPYKILIQMPFHMKTDETIKEFDAAWLEFKKSEKPCPVNLMIAVVLAGGYAKRLWPLTLNKPKALLPVAGKPVIEHIIEKIETIKPPVKKIIISTNLPFQQQFKEWLIKSGHSNIELVPDVSKSEDDKIGATKALSNVLCGVNEDFLVIAGDSLFLDELSGFIDFFEKVHAPVIALYRAKDLAEAKRGATVTLDENGRVVACVEKSEQPKSLLIGACLYAFPAETVQRLSEYVSLGLPQDQPGKFIEWLYKVEPVYGFMLKNSFLDIGTIEAYQNAQRFFEEK